MDAAEHVRVFNEAVSPDDTIALDGEPRRDGSTVIVPFRWNRTNEKGTIRLTYKSGLIRKLVVAFG